VIDSVAHVAETPYDFAIQVNDVRRHLDSFSLYVQLEMLELPTTGVRLIALWVNMYSVHISYVVALLSVPVGTSSPSGCLNNLFPKLFKGPSLMELSQGEASRWCRKATTAS